MVIDGILISKRIIRVLELRSNGKMRDLSIRVRPWALFRCSKF